MSSKRALRGAALCLAALCLALLVTGSAAPAADAGRSASGSELRSVAMPEGPGALHRAYIDAGGEFRPDELLTRGELAQFIYRAYGPLELGEFFADAPEGSEYGRALSALGALGLLRADSGGNVRPDEPVALRETVAVLSALTGREAAALPLSGGAGVTRAEGVALVNRALGRSPDVEAASQWLTPLFDDVPWGHPAYFELREAAVGHTAAGGRWLDYERELPAAGFNLVGTELYYADPATLEPLRGGYVGSLYFGADGRYTSGDELLDGYVKDILAELLEPGMGRWEALRAAYEHTRDSYSYLRRNYYLFRETGWEHDEALTMFETGRGNCYCYAAAFYYLARQLGYDMTIISGRVGSDGDPHGWVELEMDGVWRIFDPELEMAWEAKGRDFDFFCMTRAQAPWPYTK